MTTEPIHESGMIFGPYPEGSCFYIERCETYQSIQDGVKIAEFLLLRHSQNDPTVWIVEAKSSTPRPETQPNFDNFIAEIREKLVNALTLSVATCLKRHSTCGELPNSFQMLDLKTTKFRLILVVNGHQTDWLPPLQDALKQALQPMVKTWNLSPTSVVVLNDVLARSQGLIQ
ncbi:MAG: hypothetical protein MUF72_00210 [Elainella sp. Prado103]|nr:hypothetical protein [Elainella sp. Prado103]